MNSALCRRKFETREQCMGGKVKFYNLKKKKKKKKERDKTRIAKAKCKRESKPHLNMNVSHYNIYAMINKMWHNDIHDKINSVHNIFLVNIRFITKTKTLQ